MQSNVGGYIAILSGIWLLVGLAYLIWTLWSFSRLFPKIGLPASHGWIPVWNQWQLLNRAGYPGWIVLLVLVPGVGGIVVLVFWILALNRINSEFGKGGGFTFLGVILPPVWAMLLTKHIGSGQLSVTQVSSGPYAPPGHSSQQGQPVRSVFDPVMPVAQGAGTAAPAAPAPLASPPAPAPPTSAPAAPVAQARPWEAPAYSGGASASVELPPVPTAPESAPAAQRLGEQTRDTEGQQPQADGAQGAQGGQQAQGRTDWGFSNTTEDAFERLAAEQGGGAPQPNLTNEVPRPYAWPEATPRSALPQTAPAEPPAPPAPPAPPTAAPAPPAPSEQPAPPAAAPAQPVPSTHPAPSSAAPAVPGTPAAPAAPVVPVPPIPPVASSTDLDDDFDDRTIVVPKRARWGIELPGGEVLEIVGDEVLVGRKPKGDEKSITIPDPTRTISKTHARLRRSGETWTIEDLQSTNGVALVDAKGNPVPIDPGTPTEVTERLLIGTLEVTFREL